MEAVLAFIAIVIMLLDLEEHRSCHRTEPDDVPEQRQSAIGRQLRSADFEISRLTDEAVLAMLDEVRRWAPGK